MRKLPDYNYPYVKQLTPYQLNSYILGFKDFLTFDEMDLIIEWLIRVMR